jgi:hypothetical protein
MYRWRDEDVEFRAEWEDVITSIVEEAHGRLLRDARDDDSPVGVASRSIILRAHKPELFNKGLHLRHQMMQLQIEEKRRELNGPPLIEGQAIEPRLVSELEPIGGFVMPTNGRAASPHLPRDFDSDEWLDEHPDEPLPFTPVEQVAEARTMKLPSKVIVEYHHGTADPVLVSHMRADGADVSPDRATELWRRCQLYNKALRMLREALGDGPPPPVAPTVPGGEPEPPGPSMDNGSDRPHDGTDGDDDGGELDESRDGTGGRG